MKNEKPKHYCTNEDLLQELKIYHETGVITERLGRMFMEIASRFTNRKNWQGYPREMKKDLASEAVARMISQVGKFDMDRMSFVYKLKKPYVDKNNGKTIKTKLMSVSLKDGETTEIDGKTYRKEHKMLVNVEDPEDFYKLNDPNPFAYFSQITFHKNIMEAKKYYKQINIQREMCSHFMEEIECNENMDSNGFLKKILSERIEEFG